MIIEGLSAAFRPPIARSGVIPSLPVPPYTTILGLISCCAGRTVRPEETNIGFEFTAQGIAKDFERTIRWEYNKGKPKQSSERGIRTRSFHVFPRLTLYITNLSLRSIFEHPIGLTTLSQSQDLASISDIREVILEDRQEGLLGLTLLPFDFTSEFIPQGSIYQLPDYFLYSDKAGELRNPGYMRKFIATQTLSGTQWVKCANLYYVQGDSEEQHVIYVHIFGSK